MTQRVRESIFGSGRCKNYDTGTLERIVLMAHSQTVKYEGRNYTTGQHGDGEQARIHDR